MMAFVDAGMVAATMTTTIGTVETKITEGSVARGALIEHLGAGVELYRHALVREQDL